jgi:hypothetical protein
MAAPLITTVSRLHARGMRFAATDAKEDELEPTGMPPDRKAHRRRREPCSPGGGEDEVKGNCKDVKLQ